MPGVRGTRGSLPEGTSQPDDPGGVGGYNTIQSFSDSSGKPSLVPKLFSK